MDSKEEAYIVFKVPKLCGRLLFSGPKYVVEVSKSPIYATLTMPSPRGAVLNALKTWWQQTRWCEMRPILANRRVDNGLERRSQIVFKVHTLCGPVFVLGSTLRTISVGRYFVDVCKSPQSMPHLRCPTLEKTWCQQRDDFKMLAKHFEE